MKLKQILAGMVLLGSFAGFTACSDDDYSPVTLVYANNSDSLVINENNTLLLNPFSEGETFRIQGGNGVYTIDNANKDIVRCDYDGKTLTFVPVGMGTATVVISDLVGNSYLLTIQIENPKATYTLGSVDAKITAEEMTQGDINRLKARILEDALMTQGGRYEFTYTNKDLTEGGIVIYPDPSSTSLTGTFQKKTLYATDGTLYQDIRITLADQTSLHLMMLMKGNTSADLQPYAFAEDVTAQYKGEYDKLEQAYRIQDIDSIQ